MDEHHRLGLNCQLMPSLTEEHYRLEAAPSPILNQRCMLAIHFALTLTRKSHLGTPNSIGHFSGWPQSNSAEDMALFLVRKYCLDLLS